MFKEFIDAARKEYERLAKQVSKVEGSSSKTISQLESDIDKIKLDIEITKKNILVISGAIKDVGKMVVTSMNEELTGNTQLLFAAMDALKLSKEFNHEIFISGLTTAIMNPKSVSLTSVRNNLVVKFNLDETAGKAEYYGNAIKTVRSYVESRKSKEARRGHPYVPSNPSVADDFWKEIYRAAREGGGFFRRKYNFRTQEYEKRDVTDEVVEKYWDTVMRRIDASGFPAPWWELLDRGVVAVKGSGGGNPYPALTPTNFTINAKTRIIKIFDKLVSEKLRLYSQDEKSLARELARLEGLLAEAMSKLTILRADRADRGTILRQRVVARGKPYDRTKLREAVRSLNMERYGELRIDAEGRIELSLKGEKRFRISILSIIY